MIARCEAIMSFHFNWEIPNGVSIKNDKYALDTAWAFKYSRFFLGLLGVWPMVKVNPKIWETCVSRALIVAWFSALLLLFIPGVLHTILIERDPIVRLTMIAPMGFCVTNMIKYGSIIYRRRTIRECMAHVEIDWMRTETKNDREIMIRSINIERRITFICVMFMYTGGLSYQTLMPLLRESQLNELNETIRPLAVPGYEIFMDTQSSPVYEILFFTITVSASATYAVTTSASNLAATLVAHVCGQIEIIVSRCDNFFNGINEKSKILEDRLGTVIELHIRVLRLASMIENLLREICLVEVVASVIIICVLEYCCLVTWNDSDAIAIFTYIALLTSLTFNIFTICHIGELLKEQCSQVGVVAYAMDWHRFTGKTGLTLVMIICMGNIPRQITAGQMMEMSVTSFGSLMKTSLAYLNMLRAMSD